MSKGLLFIFGSVQTGHQPPVLKFSILPIIYPDAPSQLVGFTHSVAPVDAATGFSPCFSTN